MVKWAEADTALANKDYTHFNFRGASKVAGMLYKELDKEYNDYLKASAGIKSYSTN
jgi:lysophospholipase L1-like esterase